MDGIRVFAGSGRRLGNTQEEQTAREERDRLLAEQLQAELDEENTSEQSWQPQPNRPETAFRPFQARHQPPRAHLGERSDPIADILRANQRRQEATQQTRSPREVGGGLWGQQGEEFSTPVGERVRGRQSPWGGQSQQGAPSTVRMPTARHMGARQSEEGHEQDTIYGNRGPRGGGAYSRSMSSPHRQQPQQPTHSPELWNDRTQGPPPHHQPNYDQEHPHPGFQQHSDYPEHPENPENPETHPEYTGNDSEYPENADYSEYHEEQELLTSCIPVWAEGFIPPNLPPKFRLAMFGTLVVGCLLFAIGLLGVVFRWLLRGLAPIAELAGAGFIAAGLVMCIGAAWSWYDDRAEGVRLLALQLEDDVMHRMDRGVVGIHDVYVDLREEYGRGNEARFDQAWAQVTETLRNRPGVVIHNLPGTNRKAWKKRERHGQGTP